MAEQVKIPGVGPVKSEYVWYGVALVAGIVGYAWWKRGTSGADAPAPINPDLIPETDRTPVVGDSSGNFDTTDPDDITTNSQWNQKATEWLVSAGWDAALVSVALGRWLAGQGLTERETEVVLAAKGAMGDPPVGGPYPIKSALPQPSTAKTPGPPIDLRVASRAPGRNVIAWAYDGRDQEITQFNIEATTVAPGITDVTTTASVPAMWSSNTYSWVHHGDAAPGTGVRYLVVSFNRSVRGGQAAIETTFV